MDTFVGDINVSNNSEIVTNTNGDNNIIGQLNLNQNQNQIVENSSLTSTNLINIETTPTELSNLSSTESSLLCHNSNNNNNMMMMMQQTQSSAQSQDKFDSMCSWARYILIDIWEKYGDPETNNYFWLRGGPWLTWLATIAYLLVVLWIGPAFMKNRRPYDLKIVIRLYNLLLVAINLYLLIGTLQSFRFGLDYWGCSEALSLRKRTALLHYGHLFFHTRYLEFFDTFFFVLRKKQSQITFLHVFHHGVVPTLMYVGLKFYPVPFNVLLPTTNMFVHVIMYAYYGLATFGPKMQKYLWWKRYLTSMQISQFALLLIHCSQPLYLPSSCNFPTGLVLINSAIGLVFLGLFSSFYLNTYCKPGKTLLKTSSVTVLNNKSQIINGNGGSGIGVGINKDD